MNPFNKMPQLVTEVPQFVKDWLECYFDNNQYQISEWEIANCVDDGEQYRCLVKFKASPYADRVLIRSWFNAYAVPKPSA